MNLIKKFADLKDKLIEEIISHVQVKNKELLEGRPFIVFEEGVFINVDGKFINGEIINDLKDFHVERLVKILSILQLEEIPTKFKDLEVGNSYPENLIVKLAMKDEGNYEDHGHMTPGASFLTSEGEWCGRKSFVFTHTDNFVNWYKCIFDSEVIV